MKWWEQKDAWFDCYETLGVSSNATPEEIKKAYHTLVKKYHPDAQNGDEDLFKRIELAYQTLNNESSRKNYDAFFKKYKEQKENKQEEKTITFEEVVKNFKEAEYQIKVFINAIIKKCEDKENKFFSIYNDFCEAIKSGNINEHEFEVRKQKLRSVELASINSIKEVEDTIEANFSNMELTLERERLDKLKKKFKEYDTLLTSSYHKAIKILNDEIKIKHAKHRIIPYAAIASIAIILGSVGLFNHLSKNSDNKLKKAEVEESLEEEDNKLDNIEVASFASSMPDKENEEIHKAEVATDELSTNCILFQPISDDVELVEYSDVYHCLGCGYDVINAEDEYGVNYHLDANTGELLFGPYISHGPSLYDDDYKTSYFVVLGTDGYDYYIDADLDKKRVLDAKNIYRDESKPYYLEGYGYVIEAYNCGEKYLIDAETRYPLIRNFDDYGEMYYDEEFGCDVYCFTKYDGESKYYLAANDLKKVLKIENSWENN